jgi:pyrimidine operon attenuation protein/uracil phosphoribosyltransferase
MFHDAPNFRGSQRSPLRTKSDVEFEQQHVAVLDDVIAAFDAVVAGLAGVVSPASHRRVQQLLLKKIREFPARL